MAEQARPLPPIDETAPMAIEDGPLIRTRPLSPGGTPPAVRRRLRERIPDEWLPSVPMSPVHPEGPKREGSPLKARLNKPRTLCSLC